MKASRIEPCREPVAPAIRKRLDRVLPPGLPTPQVYLMLARNEGLLTHMVDTGLLGPTGLMDRGEIDSALRELVILRTCVATRNDYEFNLHVQTISEQMGLSRAQIEAVRLPSPTEGVWSAAQVAVMRLVDALVERLDVTDEEFAVAREHFDDATLIEISMLVGLYVMAAMVAALARPKMDDYQRPA
jgi:alkylhydroperoxidase family enzyme